MHIIDMGALMIDPSTRAAFLLPVDVVLADVRELLPLVLSTDREPSSRGDASSE